MPRGRRWRASRSTAPSFEAAPLNSSRPARRHDGPRSPSNGRWTRAPAPPVAGAPGRAPSSVLQPARSRGAHHGREEADHESSIGIDSRRLIPLPSDGLQLGTFRGVDEELTRWVRSAMPYADTLGLELLSASPDEVRGSVAWEQRLTTAAGLLHGGVLMGLAHPGRLLRLPQPPRGLVRDGDDRVEDELLRGSAGGDGRGPLAAAAPRQPHDRRRDRPLRRERQARRPRHADAGRSLESGAEARRRCGAVVFSRTVAASTRAP